MRARNRFYLGGVFFFLYAPILVLITFSFNQSKSRAVFTGFTLDWYLKLFQNELIIGAALNTLLVAVIAAAAATLLGTAAAVGIFAMRRGLRTLVINITYLPIINPEILTGVSLMLLYGFFQMELGFTTLIFAHITFSVPYVILSVMPKLRQMDFYIYEAALDLGCSPFQAFWKVVLPEISPGIVTGMLMALTFSLDDFIISYFTSGPKSQTLPIAIYSMTRRKVSPEINALSTIIFVVVLCILLIMNLKDANIFKERARKERETY